MLGSSGPAGAMNEPGRTRAPRSIHAGRTPASGASGARAAGACKDPLLGVVACAPRGASIVGGGTAPLPIHIPTFLGDTDDVLPDDTPCPLGVVDRIAAEAVAGVEKRLEDGASRGADIRAGAGADADDANTGIGGIGTGAAQEPNIVSTPWELVLAYLGVLPADTAAANDTPTPTDTSTALEERERLPE